MDSGNAGKHLESRLLMLGLSFYSRTSVASREHELAGGEGAILLPLKLRIRVRLDCGIGRRRRFRHVEARPKSRLESVKIPGPFLMVVHAYWKAHRTVVVFCKVRKASAGVHDVAIVSQVILTCFFTSLIRNRVCRTIETASFAGIAEPGDARVDGLVGLKGHRCRDASQSE